MGLPLLLASKWRRLDAIIKRREALGPILRNFAWLSGDKIIRMGIQFLVGAIIARHLGSEGFGVLNVALAMTGLVAVVASLGFEGILSRQLLREPSNANLLMGTVFFTRLGAVLMLYPILAIVALNEPVHNQATFLITALTLFFIPLAVFSTHFEIRLQARYAVWAHNAGFVLCTILRIWLIGVDASVAPFAATYLIEPLVTATVLIVLYKKSGGRVLNWRWDLRVASGLLKESWALMLSGFAIMIYMRLDQIMLAKMRGDAEVGIFSAALRFSEVWYFIPAALCSSLLPSLIRKQRLDTAAYETRIGQLYDVNAGLAYALIAVLVPTAPWLFSLVYGEGFAGADGVFEIHIWAALFVFLGVARSSYLINEGFTSFAFLSTLAGAILNIVLNLFLIPRYGAHGAAVATVLSQMLSAFLSSFLWAPTRPNGRLQLRAVLLPWRAICWVLRYATGSLPSNRVRITQE